MPMDEAVLDFQPLGVVQAPGGRCARASSSWPSARRWSSAPPPPSRAPACEIEGIDLSAFGMVRALASEHEGAVLYVNVAGLTNVAVANADGCLFTRAAAGRHRGDRPDARHQARPDARARPRSG